LLSYLYSKQALWFRVPKVGSRSIHNHFEGCLAKREYYHASFNAFKPNRYENWFKFTFVRDPVERVESAWRNKVIRSNYFGFDDKTLDKARKFDGFVDWLSKQDLKTCDPHIRYQSELVDFERMDFIGRMSTFDEDLNSVCSTLRLPRYDGLIFNRSVEKKASMTERMISRIKSLYSIDYETFKSF
jgi:hypothetical protein